MKKHLLTLTLAAVLITAGCKKPCYKCYFSYTLPYYIDTTYVNGIAVYDTAGGGYDTGGYNFTTCSLEKGYYTGSYTEPFELHRDSFVFCDELR